MNDRTKEDRAHEVQRILSQHGATSAEALRSVEVQLSETWQAVLAAHQSTTGPTETLREQGMYREYYLLALEDLTAADDAIEEGRRAVATLLANELGVSTTAVADRAGVSRTTMMRWLGKQG